MLDRRLLRRFDLLRWPCACLSTLYDTDLVRSQLRMTYGLFCQRLTEQVSCLQEACEPRRATLNAVALALAHWLHAAAFSVSRAYLGVYSSSLYRFPWFRTFARLPSTRHKIVLLSKMRSAVELPMSLSCNGK